MLTPTVAISLCTLTVLALTSLRRIPEGHAYTLRRIGGHVRTIGAGIHVVLPLIERVAHKINLLGNVVEVEVPAGTDVAPLRGRVYFQVMDAQRADEVIDGLGSLLQRRVPELAAGPCAEADLGARSQHLKAELNQDLCTCGVLVTRVQLVAG